MQATGHLRIFEKGGGGRSSPPHMPAKEKRCSLPCPVPRGSLPSLGSPLRGGAPGELGGCVLETQEGAGLTHPWQEGPRPANPSRNALLPVEPRTTGCSSSKANESAPYHWLGRPWGSCNIHRGPSLEISRSSHGDHQEGAFLPSKWGVMQRPGLHTPLPPLRPLSPTW